MDTRYNEEETHMGVTRIDVAERCRRCFSD
jgi:hypothetical protein